ncbi:hypothetical protein [Capnocytophaga stomatis]|uniref:Integron cassette protein VCH-CASS1 chain domain-containing protein n=1 Tax=Capnocytophaga stomatis TaxID=1848904 RepID=A0ABW8QAU2_9FLAO|nr:hypothetical protein [Capnocytophaga stomatis]GIM48668.1 hypothetical protein CAPN003_01200 [Capnocytophaga stomatis]
MAIQIDNLKVLQEYLKGVFDRANHHAQDVEGVSLALIGAILWKSDTSKIDVREYKGSPANMIWFEVNSNRYVLNYNHTTYKIDLKRRTSKGDLIESFDNKSTYQEIMKIFKDL